MAKKKTEHLTQEPDEALLKRVQDMMGPPPLSEVPGEDIEPETNPSVPTAEELMQPEVSKNPADEKKDEAVSDDALVDRAVDDIMASDSDELLRSEDEKLEKAKRGIKPSFGQRIKDFFKAWWTTPKYRRLTLLVIIIAIAVAGVVPASRHFALNLVGVRSSASLLILDEKSHQPLRNVKVQLANQSSQTDAEGKVTFSKIKLGRTDLIIEKRAYATINRKVVVGWGSNPMGDFNLTPVGDQYAFRVKDFLASQPLPKAEAISDEASAFADEEGLILLTIDKTDDSDVEVTLELAGYRTEKLTLKADDKSEKEIKMVPARKHVFVSKRNGKYDVYKVDADGQNEELLLAGTGFERDDLTLLQHPEQDIVALVSTRENVRNKDRFLLSSLFLIDINTKETTAPAKSERIQLVEWIGNRLIYVKITEGTSGNSPERHRLAAYDLSTELNSDLATSNYFNDVLAANGQIYYTASSAYQPAENIGLFRIGPDGGSKVRVMQQEVWNIFRTDYNKLSLSLEQDWYDLALGENSAIKAAGPPAQIRSRQYFDSPDRKLSLWTEERDGKGVLLVYDKETKTDKVLLTESGLSQAIGWLNSEYLVYRIRTDQETADYVMSTRGGEPQKIRDVTNIGSIYSWYY